MVSGQCSEVRWSGVRWPGVSGGNCVIPILVSAKVRRLFSFSDLVLALRLSRKEPLLTFTVVLALATGIGMATTGFTLLEAGLSARLPFAGGDRFVLIDAYQEPDARRAPIEADRRRAFRQGIPALRHVGAFRSGGANLRLSSGEVALISAAYITPDSFAVLPYTPVAGRAMNPEDARPGAPAVATIRESVWHRYYSGDSAVVGTIVEVSGVRHTIVGVMPDDLEFPTSPEIWLAMDDAAGARLFGVLRDAATPELATQQMQAVSRQFERTRGEAPRLQLTVLPFVEAVSQGLDVFATVVVAVLLMILLVISANVANLVLARSMARSTELAIRTALGASRARLVSQTFAEVLLLAGIAAAIGLLASQVTLRWITLSLTDMPFWVDFTARPTTIAFVVVVTALAAAIGGVLPALRVTSRAPVLDMARGRTVSRGFGWLGSTMIAVQITLSIALLNAALVMARGVAGYRDGGPTLAGSQLIAAKVSVEGGSTHESFAAMRRALESVPGVLSAGLASSLPRLSPPTVMTTVRASLGSSESPGESAPMVAVTEGFLESLGGQPTLGRLLVPTDFLDRAPAVAIVNEPFVRRFFGDSNPIGKQLRIIDADATADEPWREIVGVVPDLGLSAGDPALAAGFYIPLSGDTPFSYVAVRVPVGAKVTDNALRAALVRVDPRILVRDVIPIESVGAEDRAVFAGIGAALMGLGGVALVLSVIGVYAMLSFSVSQRTREIAIRSALGASRARILQSVVARASVPLIVGAIAGPLLAGGFVAARGIFAFRLPADSGPLGLPVICAVMLAAGLVATWVPARHALRLTPSDALRD